MKLLEIQISVRSSNSISRQLAATFIQAWRLRSAHRPRSGQSRFDCHSHIVRDVEMNLPAHPTEFWVKANYTAPQERTQGMIEALSTSDKLIDELLAADRIVLGVPVYNWSVPSNFKAYIDNIVRVGRTFSFNLPTGC